MSWLPAPFRDEDDDVPPVPAWSGSQLRLVAVEACASPAAREDVPGGQLFPGLMPCVVVLGAVSVVDPVVVCAIAPDSAKSAPAVAAVRIFSFM